MFYSFLKVLVRITLKIFFRKIFITGTEHINSNKAQLIASNHPNGFLEPLIMACFFPKPLHFLVRGDVFDNPFLKPMLKSTNQIPIFRFRDGFSRLRENSQTIDESLQVLIEKSNLLIFAEGNTESIKKLRPLQKGISRIAFQTLEKQPDLDLEILPVGINFTHPDQFDKTVMLRVGSPIKVSDYIGYYHEDKIHGNQYLLDSLFQEIKKNVIHIENQHRKFVFEQLAAVERFMQQKPYLPVFLKTDFNLQGEKKLANRIDALTDTEFESLSESMRTLENKIHAVNLKKDEIFKKPLGFIDVLFLIFGFIPAMVGAIIHVIPITIGFWFTKTNVKQKEFKASILMVSVLALFLINYIILLVLSLIFNWPFYIIPTFIVCGLFLRLYYVVWNDVTFTPKAKILLYRNEAIKILSSLNEKEWL